MRYLTIDAQEIDGEQAAVLTYVPDVPALPAKHMILPPDADAGHVAAMSQYLCGGVPGDCEVSVAGEARALLIDGFVTVARKRGVVVDVPDEDHVVLTSNDATTQVEIVLSNLTSVNI